MRSNPLSQESSATIDARVNDFEPKLKQTDVGDTRLGEVGKIPIYALPASFMAGNVGWRVIVKSNGDGLRNEGLSIYPRRGKKELWIEGFDQRNLDKYLLAMEAIRDYEVLGKPKSQWTSSDHERYATMELH